MPSIGMRSSSNRSESGTISGGLLIICVRPLTSFVSFEDAFALSLVTALSI
jgi:hypothetical protein